MARTRGLLSVLSVAYPLAPVGPDAVGGAEQVLAMLDAALVQRGHRSLVVACEGSRVAGTLLPTRAQPPPFDDASRERAQAAVRDILAEWAPRVDVIHLHGIDFAAYLPPPGPPVLATVHLPPDWYPPGALAPVRPLTYLHAVSAAQHRAMPAHPAVLPPIGNGVDVAALGSARHGRRNYAVSLGRICPEKGQHIALQAAHAAGIGLLIGGVVYPYPSHQGYFEAQVAPLLDRHRRLLGPLDFNRKRRLLAGARCLLAPSTAAETSSLVAMEALACGAPVIAFPSGALADMIEHGRTGFLVNSAAEMAEAIGHAAAIDPETCRAVARERFDARATIDAYLGRYAQLA